MGWTGLIDDCLAQRAHSWLLPQLPHGAEAAESAGRICSGSTVPGTLPMTPRAKAKAKLYP